jgi:hypothetical protein
MAGADDRTIFDGVNEIDLEKSIIFSYFTDDIIRDKIAQHLSPAMFNNPDAKFIVTQMTGYSKHNDGRYPRSLADLVLFCDSQGQKEPVKRALESIRVYANTVALVSDKKMTVSAFELFIRRAGTQSIFFNKLAADSSAAAWDKFLPEIAKLSNFKINSGTGSFFGDPNDDFVQKMTDTNLSTSSFLPFINQNTRGGMHSGELNVWLAAQGVGKSWMMYKNALHICKDLNKDTLIVTLEMPEQMVKERLAVMGTEQTVEELAAIKNEHGVNYLQGYVLDKCSHATVNGKKGRIRVISRPPGRYSSSDLDADLKSLDREGFNPEHIAVDYLTIMKAPGNLYGGGGDMYLSGKYLAEELRAVGMDYTVTMDTAAQLGKTAYGNLDAGHESVGISRAITETADCMIYITENELLRSNNMRKLKVGKNRNGPDNIERFIYTDYSRGLIRELTEAEDYDVRNKLAAIQERAKGGETKWH